MALSASTVWEVRNGGSDTNGGGFVTGSGGTDYSQQDAAQLSVADAACTGNTTVTSATGGFTAAMVGSIMYLSSGPGWFQITARTDTNTVTIDRNGPNASGMTANVGGAFASPGRAASVAISLNTIFIKYHASPYLITTSTPGPAGQIRVVVNDSVVYVIGYDTTRTMYNTDANRPTIQFSGVTGTSMVVAEPGLNWAMFSLYSLILDGNSETGAAGVTGSSAPFPCWRCKAVNFPNIGFVSATAVLCEADGCGTGFGGIQTGCWAHNCTIGFDTLFAERCLATDNTTGFRVSSVNVSALISGCIAYSNSGDGFVTAANAGISVISGSISVGNGGYGFNAGGRAYLIRLLDCAGFSNTSGNTGNLQNAAAESIDFVTLTADPFEDAAAGDFNLNEDAGGGADLRAVTFDLPG